MQKRKKILEFIIFCTILFTAGCNQIAQKESKSKMERVMITEKNKADDEVQIRQQMDDFIKAFRSKDVTRMMSLFSSDIVSFDIIPPLQYVGSDSYTKVWEETFALFQDPIDIEIQDLKIACGKDVAFSYCFLRLNAILKSGHKIDHWERLTCGFKKIDNKWLIVHEHVSLPVDLKNGKAVINLKP